ncbi:MAG TPA: RHS repeat-associated core domain-containing protein [Verrucomicrobiae bacterium]|nr:RHS repeat-associated core domain-containing protein [Verrucomicrobiae bacterium]
MNRRNDVEAPVGVAVVASAAHQLDALNQRERGTEADGSYWLYEYDSLGQVTSGKKYWSDGTPVAGQQFEYSFDDIGNRKQTRTGGDQNGQNLQTNNYTVTLLNQYTNRTVAGVVDVMGVALVTNSVTVNSQTPYRRGEYFRKELGVANTSAPVWEAVTVSSGGSNVTGNVFVPQTPEVFSHDADGNLTQDGRWTYTWDAENRLVSMESDAAAPTASKFRLDFAYDVQGRRIQKIVSTNDGTGYVGEYTNRFVYDGWNLLATLDPQSSLLASFAWGEDLSGTMQGAGGVGGLLWMNDAANGSTHFAAYDGNGNVVALVKASDGIVSAQYEYGPFGEVLRATGPMAKANPFRFSTKYQDDESDLLYYGYRYYNPSTGRWPNRDPIEEQGGMNLNEFVGNCPITRIDQLGTCACEPLSLAIIPVGWVAQDGANSAGNYFEFHIAVTYDMKKPDSAKCCKLIQWMAGHLTLSGPNGDFIPYPSTSQGVPLDGRWHIDTANYPKNGGGDDRCKSTPSGDSYDRATDFPGIPSPSPQWNGWRINYSMSIKVEIVDKCKPGCPVVKTSNQLDITISGTLPNQLKKTP